MSDPPAQVANIVCQIPRDWSIANQELPEFDNSHVYYQKIVINYCEIVYFNFRYAVNLYMKASVILSTLWYTM